MKIDELLDDSNPNYWDMFVKGTHSSKEEEVKSCAEFIRYVVSWR
ncbi:hypothetical protein ACN3E9_04845 [Vibrio pectenicida]